eukprot:CAMPEP_0197185698 /NCGR_PEP_ID=MMETSP1423-20130617/12459_1 /TAXON_ID=476441 /ORGANISM="Pseudo-nitzschia heimii, Strain UNC1101" /LENGTH=348 /DNA_ID=CAMNT_0042636831 /DNA_START=136 /DNA_END=1185 /DNA_ORIENTATION=-
MTMMWILWIAVFFQVSIGISGQELRGNSASRGLRRNHGYDKESEFRSKPGTIPSRVSIADKKLITDRDRSSNSDTGLSILLGSPIVMVEPPKEPSEAIETIAINAPSKDPVIVYLQLLFNSTAANRISWNLREASTNLTVASIPEQTYASQTDTTELLQLVPGEVYELEFSDSSPVLDSVPHKLADFVLEVSEPLQEIAKGQILSGTNKTLVFAVSTEIDGGDESSPPPPQQQQQQQVEINVDPSEEDMDVVDDLLSEFELSNETDVVAPEEPTPIQEISNETPELLCVPKGDVCSTHSDCCSSRCSPQKRCFPGGTATNRNRLSILSGNRGPVPDPVVASIRRRNGY